MPLPVLFRDMVFGLAVPLLLSAALWHVAQPPLTSASAKQTISATVEDVDSGQPLSNVLLGVQLFPPENGVRESLFLFCVPLNTAHPIFSINAMTDPHGTFSFEAFGGDYLVKVAVPHRQPIFGCLHIDTEEFVRTTCGAPAVHQQAFIRTTALIPGFSGDIISSSVCAPWRPSPCAPLSVPNLVKAKKIVLLGPQGSPIRNARLEFRENTKKIGRVVATRMTNIEGVADVSTLLEKGGLLRMSVNDQVAYSDFLIQFANGRTKGQQSVDFFNWRCRGDLMHGAIVQP